ncbi:MAG: hypothetical protein GJ680_14590 [Alteromonadaceae bacterium]|nr:hypothetical protein [Alteromonadaceae bacterium]
MNCHLVTTSSLNQRLATSINANDIIIFIADGCYASVNATALSTLACKELLILSDDAIARGINIGSSTTDTPITAIQYADLVNHTLNCEKVITWK